jgi:hypothetical protein
VLRARGRGARGHDTARGRVQAFEGLGSGGHRQAAACAATLRDGDAADGARPVESLTARRTQAAMKPRAAGLAERIFFGRRVSSSQSF